MSQEKKMNAVRLRHATDAQIYQELNRRSRIEITKQVLLAIAAGSALVAGAITAPNLTAFICKQIYKRTRNRQYFKKRSSIQKSISRLRQQELIAISQDKQDKITLTLTDAGQKRILKYKIEELTIKNPSRWDGKWRIIVFDIPEKHRFGRDALRDKFKTLGLYQLQKSVWVFPYACKNEVDFISNIYGIGRYLLCFETKYLENEQFLMLKFGIPDTTQDKRKRS